MFFDWVERRHIFICKKGAVNISGNIFHIFVTNILQNLDFCGCHSWVYLLSYIWCNYLRLLMRNIIPIVTMIVIKIGTKKILIFHLNTRSERMSLNTIMNTIIAMIAIAIVFTLICFMFLSISVVCSFFVSTRIGDANEMTRSRNFS